MFFLRENSKFRGVKPIEVKLVKSDFGLLFHITKWKRLFNNNIISFLQNSSAVAQVNEFLRLSANSMTESMT